MNPGRKCFIVDGRPTGLSVVLILVSLTLLLAWPRAALATGTWSETSPMATGRDKTTATLLPTGYVLVAGGDAYNPPYLDSAELFRPATGTWLKTGPMYVGRFDHTATLLLDGRVLVAGGAQWNGSNIALNSAQIYNTNTGNFIGVTPLATARYAHTATLLTDGSVLVAGGLGEGFANDLDSAERYYPGSNTWSSAGTSFVGLYKHTATRLADGRVLVAGGGFLQWIPTQDVAQLFDPNANSCCAWSSAGKLITPRYSHTATLLLDGRVLVAGGARFQAGAAVDTTLASAELFDPATLTWSATGSLATPRADHSATLLPDGRVLVAGGRKGAYMGGDLTSAEIFNPVTGTWSAADSLAHARLGRTATVLPDGRVLMAGEDDHYGTCEIYDPLNLVKNSSFETASVDPGEGLKTLPPLSNDIAHWTVLGAGIDYNGGYWQAAEGRRSLDLNALDAGVVSADLETAPGASYRLTFALAGNPDGGSAVKSLRVLLEGKAHYFSFDTTGKSKTDMGWTTKSCTFTGAVGGWTGLLFQSLTSGPYGPALDNVRVIQIKTPVPPPLFLLLD